MIHKLIVGVILQHVQIGIKSLKNHIHYDELNSIFRMCRIRKLLQKMFVGLKMLDLNQPMIHDIVKRKFAIN